MCFGLAELPFFSSKDGKFDYASLMRDDGIQDSFENSYLDDDSPDDNFNEFSISPDTHCKYFSPNDLNITAKKNFSVFHNNLNGLESKFDQIHQFLASSTNFDILAFTETSQKHNCDFSLNVNLEGYSLFSTGSLSSKGGTAIYVKNSYNCRERQDLDICNSLLESVWVEIDNKGSKNIICGCVYRHPKDDSESYNSYLNYLDSCLSKLSQENKEIYICGDFNSDCLKIDVNPNYKLFYDLISNFGFFPFITLPTRIQGNSATVIDNILSNTYYPDTICGNITSDFSDHFSQFASIPRGIIDKKKRKILRRDYSKFSAAKFRDDILLQNFDNNYDNVNDQFCDFYSKLQCCVDKHAPLKQISLNERNLDFKPWITPDLKKMITIRNKLFKKKKRQKNNANIRRAYNLFRNRVIRGLKKAKIQYYSNYFKEHNNNINKTWDGIRSLINVKRKNFSQISQLRSSDVVLTDPQEIANEFNNFFSNIGPSTEKSIPINPNLKPKNFLKNRIQLDFVVAHVSNEEVLEIINNLDNSSTGPYSIPTKLLKLIPDLIFLPLCKIINNSFATGVFPDSLKISKVIPIHKDGPTDNVNNFRPISLLSIFDKIIEKLMHKRLYKFLNENNILFKNQFGFRKKYSTTHTLLEITEKIKDTIDHKQFGCGIFIDIRKAFDTVNFKILLSKLEHYGVRGVALNWFESFLSNRKQFVDIAGFSSALKTILSGVPQGSCLGPLLFLIYINDLPNSSSLLDFFLFADDTHIFFQDSSLVKIEKTVNKELCKINDWLIVNRLSLNISKTNFVIFHPFNKPLKQRITLKLRKSAIQECKSIKYLGLIFDSSLCWKSHCDKVCKTISRLTGILYKIRPYVNKEILSMLYYSLIYPHLIYGVEIWGSSLYSNLSRILSIQKKLVRMITRNDYRLNNFSYPPSEPLFYDLGILKIKEIYTLFVGKFVYKWSLGLTPPNFCDWFKYTSLMHNYNTRGTYMHNTSNIETKKLYIPFGRTSLYGCKRFKPQ